MVKTFNVNGACRPAKHYMVDLASRLEEIRDMVDAGEYFTINRARQYGKTTILRALADYLKKDYVIVSLDFQKMSTMDFIDEPAFAGGLAREITRAVRNIKGDIPDQTIRKLELFADAKSTSYKMPDIFLCFSEWCERSQKPVVLMIDEVDSAANNQVFLDFLAQLRAYYLDSDVTPTFHCVILAGLYDIRNIAADFLVDMAFSPDDIAGMLKTYETDYKTGMDIDEISNLLYDYTSGYPYLVSRLCKFMDERIAGKEGFPDKQTVWTKPGFLSALKILLEETNPLYQSLKGKLEDYPELRSVLYHILFTGKPVPYTAMNDYMETASMFGFIKNVNGMTVIFNRIFETVLYNWFMSEEYVSNKIYDIGAREKNHFITGGHLNVRRILEKFVESFDELYGDKNETFLEDVGRRYFMLFLKPIINGTGNSYVEAETRNRERMDLVIDYLGEQFVIE